MSDGKMDISQNQQMWHDFTILVKWSTIASLVVVALMAAFLT